MATRTNGAALYLELLKRSLTGMLVEDDEIVPGTGHHRTFDRSRRETGLDWPASALTMSGIKRLEALESCIADVLAENVPGDLFEAGTWRGGAAIFMRGALRAFGDPGRMVWVADSFAGLPKPDPVAYPADANDELYTYRELAVPLEEVRVNFERYDLLDANVRFLPGWFRETLPSAPVKELALLRLDGDLYESTMVALESLYPKLSAGGFVIIDDYALHTCRAAVDDYRAARSVREELVAIDWTGVFWRKTAEPLGSVNSD